MMHEYRQALVPAKPMTSRVVQVNYLCGLDLLVEYILQPKDHAAKLIRQDEMGQHKVAYHAPSSS